MMMMVWPSHVPADAWWGHAENGVMDPAPRYSAFRYTVVHMCPDASFDNATFFEKLCGNRGIHGVCSITTCHALSSYICPALCVQDVAVWIIRRSTTGEHVVIKQAMTLTVAVSLFQTSSIREHIKSLQDTHRQHSLRN